jgi:hypothetical protein
MQAALSLRVSPRQKVGVLTFHRCINYGSYWQARCLVEGLRRRGCDAVLLDHDSPRVNRAEWRCAFQPLAPVRTSRADYRLYRRKVRAFSDSVAALPLSARFRLEEEALPEDYDLVIVGSDEVWNLRHPWYAGYEIFYGKGLRARRLASYAASFGNHDASDGLDGHWAQRLRVFSSISVRDENSRRLVRQALDSEPPLVLDPCLQFAESIAATPAARPAYAAVYGHSFPDWFADALRAWAASRSLPSSASHG